MTDKKICPKANKCDKLGMVLDKDFEIELYPIIMNDICEKCKENKDNETRT